MRRGFTFWTCQRPVAESPRRVRGEPRRAAESRGESAESPRRVSLRRRGGRPAGRRQRKVRGSWQTYWAPATKLFHDTCREVEILVNTVTHLQPYFSPCLMKFHHSRRPKEATGGMRIHSFRTRFGEADPLLWDSFRAAGSTPFGFVWGADPGGGSDEADHDTK